MEGDATDGVSFCSICSKPFVKRKFRSHQCQFSAVIDSISVSSYKRHISYCRRTQHQSRVRHRSCRACGFAKAKCSFGNPCSRCTKKELPCEYDTASRRRNPSTSLSTPGSHSESLVSSPDRLADGMELMSDWPVDFSFGECAFQEDTSFATLLSPITGSNGLCDEDGVVSRVLSEQLPQPGSLTREDVEPQRHTGCSLFAERCAARCDRL